MKHLAVLFTWLLPLQIWAQVHGNKQLVTRDYELQSLRYIEMSLYADVEIDCSAAAYMKVTADENLLDLIDTSVEDGKLVLVQKAWIQPSQKIKINIGAPELERIQISVHETIHVKNIDRPDFNAMAILGKLILQGRVEELSASGEIGEVDARQLEAPVVNVNLWDRGKILLGSPARITGIVKESGRLIYEGEGTKVNVRTQSDGKVRNLAESQSIVNPGARFIAFRLKNNSLNRIQCYVVGPKPDGSQFSYGFPMNPGQVRKKNWSVGSKVYRVSALGTRKLLTEIKAGDEDGLVKLYD